MSEPAPPDPDRANDRLRLRVTIKGRVQGVWYRESMRREAEGLGVAGWVRNCPDGTVTAVIEGPREKVERVVAWCRQGPPAAHVESVKSQKEPPCGESAFRVCR